MPSRARAIACSAAVVMLVAAAPGASAKPSTRAERFAAARAFAQRTVTFASEQETGREDALRALAARRASAQDCLAVWRSAPAERQRDLGIVYFEYLSGALWSVDAPLYRHWITDLRRSPRIDRWSVLARGADALRRRYVVANSVYIAVPDACRAVTRWRDAGWGDVARPAVLKLLATLPEESRDGQQIATAAAQLVRYGGRNGTAAAEVLSVGVDEPDERVNAHTGCDAVGALVLPDAYEGCPPAG